MLWHADVELPREVAPTDDQAARLAEALPGYVIAMHDKSRQRLVMRFEVMSRTLASAVDKALDAAKAASTYAFGDAHPEPRAVRVLPAEDHELEAEESGGLDLVGFTQIGELLGVSRQRAAQLAERDDFPPQAVPGQGQTGPLFTRTAVLKFAKTWDRKTGRPRKAV